MASQVVQFNYEDCKTLHDFTVQNHVKFMHLPKRERDRAVKQVWDAYVNSDHFPYAIFSRRNLASDSPVIAAIWSKRNLTELHIGCNNLSYIPKEISALVNLTTIYLEENRIEHIPPEICNLPKLRILRMNKNCLREIPEEISGLTSLTHLCLSENRIRLVPGGIGKLQSLVMLNLENNEIEWLPTEIGDLKNLERLYLTSNRIGHLTPRICDLENLQKLELGNNYIESLPEDIGNLRNLKLLQLERNELNNLPKSFGRLYLDTLYLSHNRLSELPASIGCMHTLKLLCLDDNWLVSIPPEIGNLTQLTTLLLNGNRLMRLPPEIGFLQNIEDLSVYDNPLEFIPRNVERLLIGGQNVYNNPQSVHNSTIQSTLRESILRLLAVPPLVDDVMPLILDDPVLSEGTKESLLEHCQDTSVHTVLNVSFKDILHVVWNRILAFPESAPEIKRVLETEMRDADGMCFIGRISRLVNCLNGFDSLVSIRISDNEQISNVISVVRIFLLQSGEYTPEAHKEEVRKRLKELSVADDVIAEWVSNIE